MDARSAVAVLVTFYVAACATPVWKNDLATPADFERDRLECQGEIPIAEANYAMVLAARGYGGAVKQMNEDSAAKAMFRANLIRLCLLARGYRQLDMERLGPIQQHVPEPPPMYSAPMRMSAAEKMEWIRMIAERNECGVISEVAVTVRAAGEETYRLACAGGKILELACDFTRAIHDVDGVPTSIDADQSAAGPACLAK